MGPAAERLLSLTPLRARVPPGLPPGPSAPPALQLYQFVTRPIPYLTRARAEHGDCITLRLFGLPPVVQFCRPEHVREVFTGSGDDFHAGKANAVLEPILGPHSVLLLDGPRHMEQRRLLLPPFRGERMAAYAEVMAEVTERAMASWPVGRPLSMHAQTQAITLEIILRTVFGVSEGEETASLRDLLTALTREVGSPFALVTPLHVDLGRFSQWGRVRRLLAEVHAQLGRRIRARRAEGRADRDDILSMLLEATHEDGSPMRDEEIRDELMTLLLAGHETTATGLAWAFHRLSLHRDVHARVSEELDAVLGADADPTRVRELPLLDAVARETLRIHPVISGVGRVLQAPARVGGYELPRGVMAAVSVYNTHFHERTWPDPHRFSPERFLERKPTPYEWVPFGGGIRRCIGMAFALYEMDVVLATVLSRFTVEPAPGVTIRTVRRALTLAPSDGMPIVVRRRSSPP